MSSQIITIDDDSTAMAIAPAPAAASTSLASQEHELGESKMAEVIANEDSISETEVNDLDENRVLKRKQSLESQLTSGCGGGKKKARIVDAFYDTLWPILEEAGWKMVKGEGNNDGAVYFLPTGVSFNDVNIEDSSPTSVKLNEQSISDDTSTAKKTDLKLNSDIGDEWECTTCSHFNSEDRSRCKECMGWKGDARITKPHPSCLHKVRDVIERVLNSSNEVERKAAEAYMTAVPDALEQFTLKTKELAAPSQGGSPQKEHDDMNWKHERKHYPKATSRVGDEYQATELPLAGSYLKSEEQSDVYDDLIWDWKTAQSSGKVDFCARVTPNKKTEAYEKFYQRGFVVPGFYQEVCSIPTTNGSDWTEDEKKRFRVLIFKEQKSIIKVSKTLGKPMKECMTYYYATFKRSADYPRLKLAIYRHKQQAVKTRSANWICDTCGVGGTLIACDSCDAHYHLTCLDPPLKEVPEGTWICSACSAKKDEAAAENGEESADNLVKDSSTERPKLNDTSLQMSSTNSVNGDDVSTEVPNANTNVALPTDDSRETTLDKEEGTADSIEKHIPTQETIDMKSSNGSTVINNVKTQLSRLRSTFLPRKS